MQKKLLTYLVPIVLVIGTAFGAGMVVGDDWEEDSDVEVGVDFVEPEIEWVEKKANGEVIYPNGDNVWLSHDVEIYVKVEIDAPGHDTVVDSVDYKFYYTGDEPAGDAAVNSGWVEADIIDPGWDEGTAEFEGTVTLPENKEMWRYGDVCSWKLDARVTYTDEDGETQTKCEVQSYGIEEHLNILWADDASASGDPGETLEPEAFQENGEYPQIKITANSNWQLGDEFQYVDAFVLDGPDGNTIDDEDTQLIYDVDTYEDDGVTYTFAEPTWESTHNLLYEVEIPFGQMHGTYETTLTHELINTE